MRESDVRKYLLKKVEEAGGEARKLSYEGRTGALDWLLLFEDQHAFVELKRPGEKRKPHQKREADILHWAGARAYVADCPAQIDLIIEELMGCAQ